MDTTAMTDDRAQFDLPPPCMQLVDTVVRSSRLWPWEKLEVRAELESHFAEAVTAMVEDGMDENECIKSACEEFGDAKLAARLIRRAKRRNRPMIWKIASAVTIVLVVSSVAAAGILGWLAFGEPNPQTDYVQILNDPIETIPTEQRSWPILRDLLPQFQPMPNDVKNAAFKVRYPNRIEDAEAQAAADAWLEVNAQLVPQLYTAANKPYSGFVYGQADTQEFLAALARRGGDRQINFGEQKDDPLAPKLIAILLPHLADVRDAARYMVLHARSKMFDGNYVAAIETLDATRQLGLQQMQSYTLIEQLVGAAIVRLAADEWFAMLYHAGPSLTPEAIEAIRQSEWMNPEPLEPIRMNYDGERMMFEDVVQYVFTDDGDGNGRLIPKQLQYAAGNTESEGVGGDLSAVVQAAVHADRKETMAYYNRIFDSMIEKSRLPLSDPEHWTMQAEIKQLEADKSAVQRFALVSMMLPALTRADTLIAESNMTREAARAAGAITLHLHDHGDYPRTLDLLTPEYLPSVPLDIYTGEPLTYELKGEAELFLYSVGGNFEDNGASIEVTKHQYMDHKGPADIVFWPPIAE